MLKKLNNCGNNNNNLLNHNNNTIHKSHKGDSNHVEHISGQCGELKQANVCSVQSRCDEMAVLRTEIRGETDDVHETDTHSPKSNASNIDVESEKDERKPILKTGIIPSDTNQWLASPDKLPNESVVNYTNCDSAAATAHHSNGMNITSAALKKEVSLFYHIQMTIVWYSFNRFGSMESIETRQKT